jgi:hypothetical protein
MTILYEQIPLPNGLSLELWDYSRQIAANTSKVELVARIAVAFHAHYFPRKDDYDKLVKTIGLQGWYEHRKFRTFVTTARQEEVFQELLSSFKKGILPYLTREDFPQQFARLKFRDLEQNWYKYEVRDEED